MTGLEPAVIAGLVATGIGSAVSAVSAIRQGNAAKNAADFQADVAGQQAAREKDNARIRSEDFRRRASAAQATGRAEGGASNRELFSGSAARVEEDLETEKELNIQRLLNQGEVSSNRLEQQAELTRSSGRGSRTAGFIGAGSSLLSGVSSGAKFLK